MNKPLLYSSLIATIWLSGCAIGPDYVKPTMPIPETPVIEKTVVSTSVIDRQWWTAFQDPKLNLAMEEAFQHNFDLQASQASVEAILGQFDQTQSYLYPQINANASMNHKEVDHASSSYMLREGVTATYATSLSLASYEIDLFGKVRRANEAARATLLASEYGSKTVALTISASVAASYVKLSSLQSQIDLARQNLTFSNELAELNTLKFNHGAITESIYLQSMAERENAKATLSSLEALKCSEEATYNVLLGRNPQRTDISSMETITLPNIPAYLPSELLTKRPDIAAAEQNLIASNAKIGIAKAGYFPSIKLTGMLGLQSLELNNLVSNPSRLWEITPAISIPVFSAGRIAGEIKSAEAESNQSIAQYKKAVVNAFNDTHNALIQTTKAKEQQRYQILRVQSIKKALEQSKLRYQVGSITYADLLQLQQQWLSAEQNLLIAKQNAFLSTISLYKALGGGWVLPSATQHF